MRLRSTRRAARTECTICQHRGSRATKASETPPLGAATLDADLAALRLSNRKPAFLDWLLDRLGEPGDEQALRLAQRYLGPENAKDATTAKAWIEANRPFLFFSDTGGYRWFVDTNAQRTAKAAAPVDAGARK
ncbi:MAG TPA: hypothetical protein VFD82_07495 [Planctomycetota bacterium]|nr:hypothetical protein [Planctomycetota bacterium]